MNKISIYLSKDQWKKSEFLKTFIYDKFYMATILKGKGATYRTYNIQTSFEVYTVYSY